jgi:hypothetical protein
LPGVIFSYPKDGQIDVPVGSRLVVAFSDQVTASAIGACSVNGGAFCLVGPDGPVDVTPAVAADGMSVQLDSLSLDAGAKYQLFVGSDLAPFAKNLPADGSALVTFTTRNDQPRSGPPTLVGLDGADPAQPDLARPFLDTTTLSLVFSEPLDTRSVVLGPGAVQLLDSTGAEVPATLVADGIHVSIDPVDDLVGGASYQLVLGSSLVDLSGEKLAPLTFPFVPRNTHAVGSDGSPILYSEVLRTRQPGDPGWPSPRLGSTPNAMALTHPLIGNNSTSLLPGSLAGEIGDTTALGGPISLTVRRGQRLHVAGIDVALGGQIPVGVSTGDIEIEILTDANAMMYRNPYQSPDQSFDNARAPSYADLSLDLAVYAQDPTGNAVLSQTVLGVRGLGVVSVTDGVLDLEAVTSLDLNLLGVTKAPANMSLEVISDANAQPEADTTPPSLVTTYPQPPAQPTGQTWPAQPAALPVDSGIELIFSEPIDLEQALAGGIALLDCGTPAQAGSAADCSSGTPVDFVIESAGSVVVVRPRALLGYGETYQVALSGITDVAGNALAQGPASLQFATPVYSTASTAPMMIVMAHPGVGCALTKDGNTPAYSPGHCLGTAANAGDDDYQPFTVTPNEPLDIAFSQPIEGDNQGKVTLSPACGAPGSVQVEQLDSAGSCMAAVPGALVRRERSLRFVPDQPWLVGSHYSVSWNTSPDTTCRPNTLCGGPAAAPVPANFQALAGPTPGGASAVFPFDAIPANNATYLITPIAPFSDINGTGILDPGELPQPANSAHAMVTAAGGFAVSPPPATHLTPGKDTIYTFGGLAIELQTVQQNCELPDGTAADYCLPAILRPQSIYGTSIEMVVGNALLGPTVAETGLAMLRIREPIDGPPTGYVVNRNGKPTLVALMDVYMDAPSTVLPALEADTLHSLSVRLALEGTVEVGADGRMTIGATNTANVTITVSLDFGAIIAGTVTIEIPQGNMGLTASTPAVRGAPR